MSDEQMTAGNLPDPTQDAQHDARLREEKYDRLLRMADFFDNTGEQMRDFAKLGDSILRDDDVTQSQELSTKTYRQAEEDIRHATTGKHSVLSRSIELDADALVVRATVLTYRWIDELQEAAYKTLGAIAGRAIGYLAPEVALGGAIVSAGLIETDALDRDGVAAYLNELAENNPDLLDHVSSGGGGLLDSLTMRSMLAAGALAGEDGPAAGRGGLRAAGVAPFSVDLGDALRDVAADFTRAPDAATAATAEEPPPASVEEVMQALVASSEAIRIVRISANQFICYLPGPNAGRQGRLQLVAGDVSPYVDSVVDAIDAAITGDGPARVMLVGSGQGGVAAVEIAAKAPSDRFVVDQIITAGSPRSAVQVLPERTRVLSLEDRADPVALLGSLINEGVDNRMTVVFDGSTASGERAYVAGGRAADRAENPDLRAELSRLTSDGYLAG